MDKPVNNYLKLLLYLKQYEGDGLFHLIEDILPIDKSQQQSIWVELAREDLIKLTGGHEAGSITFGSGETFGGGYIVAEAKITFKGSKYLKEELEMRDNNKYNISVGDNSTANLILHSPGATINNRAEIVEQANKIIKAIESDDSADLQIKKDVIVTMSSFINEVNNDRPSQETINKVLSLGSNISSIGSLVISLLQLFIGK